VGRLRDGAPAFRDGGGTIGQRGVFERRAAHASPAENDPRRLHRSGTAQRTRSSTWDEGQRADPLDTHGVDGDERRRGPEGRLEARDAVDIALGAGTAAAALAATAARSFVAAAAGAFRLGARMSAGRPHTGLAERLADRGGRFRDDLARAAAELVRWILPQAVERALAAVDLTDLVRAHVDLDALAKILDVDAVVSRVDLDAAVSRVDLDAVISRVDLDALVAQVDLDAVISRVDLDGVASRLDLDAIIDRADLDRAVSRVDLDAVISRVDLDGVASRLDLDAIIDRADLDRAVSRVDLGAIVQRVDPDEVVARVDIEAALTRLDLEGIARQVIEAIDLAEIIRESAGAVSSQAARVVRTEGMNADDSVARFFDRVLRRPHPGGAVTP
jgi:hypothetical protein